ncbi:MAG: UDP-N-acetylglucosamine 1-carboxyvinyltransferase [Clostridia bacterium]|nr:UDP-N-acetylglucosamine 1-carboxyvinyltransferase [Clostridia bacterium]
MQKIWINGGNRLSGELPVSGAKNSILPLLSATVLCKGESIIHNCPALSDVETSIKILKALGCKCTFENATVIVNTDNLCCHEISEQLMREMRSSIVFLGAIAGRCHQAVLSSPGGCELGPRPIDLHLSSLRRMGLSITEDHGVLDCKTDGLHGAQIDLAIPSVGATENIILAAALAEGRTVIHNAAREPEIMDLADFLNKAGAKICGAGTNTVTIDGVRELHGVEHRAIPDRIAAATYMSAAAITGGNLTLHAVQPEHIMAIVAVFKEAGCSVKIGNDFVSVQAPEKLRAVSAIKTLAYPGFPTDAQPPLLSMFTLARGTSIFVETIFANRFKYVDELKRLGADIHVEGNVAVVRGVSRLCSATVMATDLRGGAALVIAGLAAAGQTEIGNLHHIDRGYEHFEENLSALGADIKRI